jgi:hypothetical protein
MPKPEQNYANHVRLDPHLHGIALPFLLLSFILALGSLILQVRSGLSLQSGMTHGSLLLLILGSFVVAAKARLYALKVQDRVIALEVERRFERLGGKSEPPLSEKLKPSQLVGLRFASDAELVALADRAAAEGLTSKQIKQAIKNWRGDYRRI